MAGIVRIISVAIPILAAWGCGPTYNMAGTWKGKRVIKSNEGADDIIARNTARVELKMEPTGRFELFELGFPSSGTWQRDALGAVLQVDQLFDRHLRPEELPKEMVLAWRSEGKATLQSGNGSVDLIRESQPNP